MAKKARKKKIPKGTSVFKQQLDAGTLPRAKTWGKKDQTPKQRRQSGRKELRDEF